MSDLLILGTDTDAGKTTFALLWTSAFADQFEYWKPVETGPSDSRRIAGLVPAVIVHAPHQRFEEPVAPVLAARLEGKEVLPSADLARAKPLPARPDRAQLIETFGSPFSPLNDTELQLALIRKLSATCVLVTPSTLGAIGRTLQVLAALESHGVFPGAAVLIGRPDEYARAEVRRHGRIPVYCLEPPGQWEADAVRQSAEAQHDVLVSIHAHLRQAPVVRQAANAAEVLDRDRRHVWHPYTSLREPDAPLLCQGARDEFLELADGRHIIDGISSWWTILHSHRHPALLEALQKAAAQIDHVHFAGVTHPWAVALAERLLRGFVWEGGRVFYSDNGSTAVEVALKLAYQYWCEQGEPRRTRFIGFEHGYHGDTFGSMAVSRDPVFFGRFEPLLFQADILPLDPVRLEEHLQMQAGRTAAVILEPLVQGAGGMRMHSPETLRAVVEAARRHKVLFIADEVMTGSGRTGTMWAHQAAGVHPDLVCAAKTLAGGLLPLAATLAAPPIVEAFDTDDRRRTFFHGHSFTAHPLACAVAIASNQLLASTGLGAPVAMERFWKQALEPLRRERGVKDVRVRGSIGAVEVDVEGGYLAGAGRQMRAKALEMGVLLRPLGSVLYAMPPFCTAPGSLERIADAMHAAVRAVG
jgi:adenosylmethionine-8-amino-7-oxononanoate aminotransferase